MVIGLEFFKGVVHSVFCDINLIPMSLVLCKVRAGYDLGHGDPRRNHLKILYGWSKIIWNEKQQLDTLITTIHIYSEDIRMEFGTSKWGIFIMQKRKLVVHTKGIEFPSSKEVKET